mmetsp:Transcript_1969/g.6135  ORF Transcript_1969/g.6135 Transcript_1969/m.6135 type:complete len:327 (+) Transcript_1969:697-1677(+)
MGRAQAQELSLLASRCVVELLVILAEFLLLLRGQRELGGDELPQARLALVAGRGIHAAFVKEAVALVHHPQQKLGVRGEQEVDEMAKVVVQQHLALKRVGPRLLDELLELVLEDRPSHHPAIRTACQIVEHLLLLHLNGVIPFLQKLPAKRVQLLGELRDALFQQLKLLFLPAPALPGRLAVAREASLAPGLRVFLAICIASLGLDRWRGQLGCLRGGARGPARCQGAVRAVRPVHRGRRRSRWLGLDRGVGGRRAHWARRGSRSSPVDPGRLVGRRELGLVPWLPRMAALRPLWRPLRLNWRRRAGRSRVLLVLGRRIRGLPVPV